MRDEPWRELDRLKFSGPRGYQMPVSLRYRPGSEQQAKSHQSAGILNQANADGTGSVPRSNVCLDHLVLDVQAGNRSVRLFPVAIGIDELLGVCHDGMPDPSLEGLDPTGFAVDNIGNQAAQNVRSGSLDGDFTAELR